MTAPAPAFSVSLAQISAATFACGPLMAAAAIVLGRLTPVVVLDVCGCWVLAAALLAGHRLSQRAPLASGPHPLRNLACLLGFGAIGLAVVVSYNVQVAGPDAEAGTVNNTVQVDPLAQLPLAQLQPLPPTQGTTNIDVHCESSQGVRRPEARR